jgi:methionyl aminopeptidase
MFTRVKTATETEAMRISGRMLATVLQLINKTVSPGMSGKDISELAARELAQLGGKPSFLGYYGFPDVICVSANDAVVHGIPNAVPFEKGDIVSIDFGVTYQGMITDSAFTMVIGGQGTKEAQRLIKTTEQSLYAGIDRVRDGVRVGDIAAAIQGVLSKRTLTSPTTALPAPGPPCRQG